MSTTSPRRKGIGTALVLIAILVVISLWVLSSQAVPVAWDFRNNLWGPAYLLLQGRSPYNIHVIYTGSNAIWMPVIIGALFPVGLLPLQAASNLWLVLNLLSLWALVAMFASGKRMSMLGVASIVLGLAMFPSTMSVLRLGQVTLLVCLALSAVAKQRKVMHPVLMGLLLAASLAKPQLLALFVPALAATFAREQPNRIRSLIGYTAGWTAVLLVPLFLLYPRWILDWIYNLTINANWFHPSVYSFLMARPEWAGLAQIAAAAWLAAGIALCVILALRLGGTEALLWSLALTPLFSPIGWSWDFVLFYPLIIFMIIRVKPRASAWILYVGLAACTIAFLLMKFRGLVEDQLTAWVPPAIVVTLLLSRLASGTGSAGSLTD